MSETKYPIDAFDRYFSLADALTNVGPGWKAIVTFLWKGCELYHIPIHQIKEKFGGLRFYVGITALPSVDRNFLQETIHRMEEISFTICELCGEPGILHANKRGWVKTLCPEHIELRDTNEEEFRKLWLDNETMETCHLFSPDAIKELQGEDK